MHVVVDTNVLVSGIFWAGTPGDILDAWTADAFTLLVTKPILEEYFEIIDRIAAKVGRTDLATIWKTSLFDHAKMIETMPCSSNVPSAPVHPTLSVATTTC